MIGIIMGGCGAYFFENNIEETVTEVEPAVEEVVMEEQDTDEAQEPIDSFAFDFWQNSKYVYRGVDTIDSEPVKANEEQMDKALAKMN